MATTLGEVTRLEHVIARNVAHMRAEKGRTQAELATKMRANGFAWGTNRVTQIETLHRPVSLLEVVGLSRVFSVSVTDLLAGDDDVDMPDGSTMPLQRVRDALTGVSRATVRDVTDEEHEEYRLQSEDLRKVAARVHMAPEDLDAASYRIWGQSFWAERASREGDTSGMKKRSAQTKRGHVTRQLMTEVLEWKDAQKAEGGSPSLGVDEQGRISVRSQMSDAGAADFTENVEPLMRERMQARDRGDEDEEKRLGALVGQALIEWGHRHPEDARLFVASFGEAERYGLRYDPPATERAKRGRDRRVTASRKAAKRG